MSHCLSFFYFISFFYLLLPPIVFISPVDAESKQYFNIVLFAVYATRCWIIQKKEACFKWNFLVMINQNT